jgi:prolycopene isomerase
MSKATYEVIVVGGGLGGAACAALLAKEGVQTLLLEKNDRPGGKALSMSRGGFTYELWPIVGGPQLETQFEAVLKELGMETEFEVIAPDPTACMLYRGASGEYKPYLVAGRGRRDDLTSLIPWLGLKPEDLEEFGRLLGDIMFAGPQELEALDEFTFHEFISRYRIAQPLYSYIAAQMNIIFVLPPDLISASEASKTLRDFIFHGSGCYFKGGYGRLAEVLVEAVKRNGGKVRLRTRVERINVEDGQVRGVVTRKDSFQAPIVVSNAGIQPTVLKLVGEEHFDKGYVNYVKELVPSLGLMGSRYFLSKPVLEHGMYVAFSEDSYWNVDRWLKSKAGQIPDEVIVFMVVPSVYDSSLAPPGKQCALAATLCSPEAQMKHPQLWWDKLDEMVAKIWPDLPRHIESQERYSTADVSVLTRDQVLPGVGGECIGLGQVVGQCGRHKPSAKAPLQGLFYVGCDSGGYGCGTHQAVDSAVKVARIVLQYHRMHHPA